MLANHSNKKIVFTKEFTIVYDQKTKSVKGHRILIQATLHQLKVFEATARLGSFTRAAEELLITQPTVSSQIKQLSKVTGLPLFEQIGKRLYLTEAGKELLIACQDIFECLENFEMKVADLKGTKQGRLRLSAITTAKYFIPRLLGNFCKQYPGIDVSLEIKIGRAHL